MNSETNNVTYPIGPITCGPQGEILIYLGVGSEFIKIQGCKAEKALRLATLIEWVLRHEQTTDELLQAVLAKAKGE